MKPPNSDTDADSRPSSGDEPDLTPTARVELDLGWTGRILDVANTLSWGLTAGAGIGTWVTLCLGMTSVFGADPLTSDRITRATFGAFFLAAVAFFVVASAVSAVRTLHYAQHVGEALSVPDAAPVADYQAWTAAGTTSFGKPFVGWYAIAIIIMSVGAVMMIAAISFLAEGESGSSTLFALGITVGCVAVGIAIIVGARRLRALRARLCPDDPRDTPRPHPRGARRVPHSPSRSHRVIVRIQTIVLNSSFVVLFGGIIAFIAWGVLTGQVVVIGGHVRAIPEDVRSDLSPGAVTALGAVAMILAVTAIVSLLLVLVVIVLGGVRRIIAVRVLAPYATSADDSATRPRKDLSEDALTPYSGARRTMGVVGAIAAGLFVAAATPLSTVIPVLGPGALVGLGVFAIVVTGIVDIITEPRARQSRNLLFAAWPSAHAFTTRYPPKKNKKKSAK